MASSSNIPSGNLATYTVKVAGNTVPGEVNVLSVRVEKRINRVSTAIITILDGEANTGTFEASSSSVFVPGNIISIEAGYDSSNTVIFKGIITRQSILINDLVGSALEVECKDEAIKMTVGRKSLTFAQKKDSDVISSIISSYSSLTPDVSGTTTVWPEQVQFYVSDWDFMLSLAEMNGLVVTTLNGTVAVKAPGANPSPVITIGYGRGLMEFRADMNAITQLESVKSSTWDYKQQQVASAEAPNNYAGPGNISSKTLAEVVGLPEYELQTTAAMETEELNNWAKAQMLKSEYAKIQGEAKFQGTNLVDPGKFMTLNGLGDRFNGDYLISGVIHDLSDGNWLTEVSVGLSPQWFIEEPDVMAPSASGMLPGVRGIFNGTVKKMYDDPDSQYRILVDVPLFDQTGQGIWARLANFYSTSGAGAFFLPEVGDEVVLGFLNEDPRNPVILGSMYSSPKNKPYTGLNPNEKNSIKAIVSKSNINIEFDDENKVLTIATPDKNTMIFSDKDKKITIQDEHNNSIVMSASGITIKSATDINIQADQKVNIAGTQGVTVKAPTGDVAVSGLNIKQVADSQFSAEGSMTTEIKSGMELSLKSAMIMIN
ncbi:type VI secretion system tip protein VgrG [Pedobacter alluvionis]|uniref:Rhs element Vgr protein n=1 Tax=Pedobacter alluvionis TaxID=475253 RepID=A0A497YBR8_9SPHI|nr:type VI secretion system tip protein VgrG [Pedobacter alluvionis]RLJ80645.1 Rhs element Vgr protein [Pedobacter alluvionis]TFB31902.1 type VI secretion system tip protein VgrG [Pedobacter alluvionis]